jgi:anti-sigma factor RsiW
MNSCNQIYVQMHLYLDEELGDKERSDFERHIAECDSCRAFYEEEKRLLENIRSVRPLYEASPVLRSKIVQTLGAIPAPYTAPSSLRRKIQNVLRPSSISGFSLSPKLAIAFALVLITIAFAGIITFRQILFAPKQTQTSDFALMAVETHLRRLRGQLPLEVVTESPEQITRWFAGKVSFNVKLPNYQESSGQEKLYNLEGARLVALNNDYAAYIAYQMRGRPITLVVTSNTVAQPSGGVEIVSKGITFHYDAIKGQKVITWSDRGLTYALVSDLEERGQQSCLVCHTGTKDRDFIEGLKP